MHASPGAFCTLIVPLFCSIISTTSQTISTPPSPFASCLSLLLLPTCPCPSPSLSASFLPLHLYYPLNNSLCIKLYFCFFPPFPHEGTSLEALVPGRTSFVAVLHPSLCFLPFLCCQEILLPSLLGDAARDYSPPTFDLLPKDTVCVCACLLWTKYLTICIHLCPCHVVRHANTHSYIC